VEWYLANGREAEANDAIAIMTGYLMHTSKTQGLRELLESRVADLDDATAGPVAPRLLNELARSYLYARRVDDALTVLDRGLHIAERLLLEPEMAELFATKSWAAGLTGRHRESMLLAEGSLQIAERHGMVKTQLRARMNLSDLYVGSEPRRGYEIARVGVEVAERVGHISWAAALAANESFAGLVLGEWKSPIRRAAELDRPQVTAIAHLGLLSTAAVARAYTGQPGDHVQDPDEVLSGEGADAEQIRAGLSAFLAWEGFASGELDEVDRLAVASSKGTTNFGEAALALCQAIHATVWLRDRGRLEAALQRVTDHGWAGAVKSTMVSQGTAALAAMDGVIEDAERGYRETLAVWRRLDMKPDVAIAQMEMLLLMGDRLPDSDALAAEARTILTELGAASLLRRLDDVAPATREMEVAT
jgi:hypothetical protein